MRVIYESTAKLEPLKWFYQDKSRSLKLKANRSLVIYANWFQGLDILHQKIDRDTESEKEIFIQMVEHIEDPLFSGPCKTIKTGTKYIEYFVMMWIHWDPMIWLGWQIRLKGES